jgi:hypothetical protein
MIEGAPSAVTVCATPCLLVQVTFWPTFTFRVAEEKAKSSMATAVPLAVVPAALLLGPPP